MLNAKYVTAPSLQMYFVDKNTGFPLAGGKVFFYRDKNRTEPKTVYELQGNAANYTYAPLPNPIILSNVGTIADNTGNDVIPYYYPYDENGEEDLYYIVVQSSTGVPQFTRSAWPNPAGGGSVNSNELINYIPNGQLLAHTDLKDNLLVPGTNIIAQGGIAIVLDDTATSVNTVEFIPEQYTEQPPQSPRFICDFICTSPNPVEVDKAFRIFFNDVNKFASDEILNTFGVWMVATSSIPVIIRVYKYFGIGGSAPEILNQSTATITTSPTFFNFLIDFQINSGFNVGPNGDDFVAIDIVFPTNLTFDVSISDLVLTPGNVTLLNFPAQTNADMIARGIFGWADLPQPRGFDLYLYPMLTRKGMAWDHSVIGMVQMADKIVPNADDITASEPIMPSNSHTYFYDDYSTIGIPFARYGDFLINTSPIAGIPKYGTGNDFATAYALAGDLSTIRLTVNANGVGSIAASDGNIGWVIGSIVTYNGSMTGSASIDYLSYNNVADTLLCIRDEPFSTAALVNPSAGTTPFTVIVLSPEEGLTAFKYRGFTLLCTAAVTLIGGSGNPGLYWQFSSSTIQYYMWFYFNGETDPAPGGLGIQVNLNTNYTAQDVANIIREAMNAFQISTINVSSVPLPGQYWLFSSNPGATENWYVWYVVDEVGTDPMIAGRVGIKVSILSTDSLDQITSATMLAIDKFKFAAPPFQGMFARGYDPDGLWDLDNDQRWSAVSGLSGAQIGTFEYQQFLNHYHIDGIAITSPGPFSAGTTYFTSQNQTGSTSGGTETRPVNFYTNFVVRY